MSNAKVQPTLAYCNFCNKDTILVWKSEYKVSDGYKKWFKCKECNHDRFTFYFKENLNKDLQC